MDEDMFEALAEALWEEAEANQADPLKAVCAWVDDTPLGEAVEEIPF